MLYQTIRSIYCNIRDFFSPHNVIKLKKLPRHWTDIDGKIEAFLEQMLDDFIYKEKCFEVTDWDYHPEKKKQKEMILAAQEWFTKTRPELEKRNEKILSDLFKDGDPLRCEPEWIHKEGRKEKLDEHTKTEKQIYDTNTQYYRWIIENRDILWT